MSKSASPGLIVPRLRVGHLRAFLAKQTPEVLQDYGRRHFVLWCFILKEFLGEAWVERNALATALGRHKGRVGHLELEFATDEARERKSMRLFDIAEMVFNLQTVEGFSDCIDRMKTAGPDQVESTYAEMQVAKLLYIHDMDFRIVKPHGVKGDDYDIEINFPGGWLACADVKCKLESTTIDADSVTNTLNDARKQLPSTKPGIVFVKVPQEWFEGNQMAASLRSVTADFLRNTRRVVSVKFYVSRIDIVHETQQTLMRHAHDEINNQHTRFTRKHWDIFKGFHVPTEWNGMPPKWVRLMHFPLEE